jgi:hypothetical protein
VQALFENTLYVIVPVGWYPPLIVAVSVAELPRLMLEGVTTVVIAGVAGLTVKGSHALVAPALLESPL